MNFTPASELESRWQKLQQQLCEHNIDLALLVQNADLFYFTGSIQQGVLLVPASGEPVYCVRKEFARAQQESQLKNIVALKSPRYIPDVLQEHNLAVPRTLAMELDVVPVATYNRFTKPFAGVPVQDVTPLIRLVRMVKSPYELQLMALAAKQEDIIYRRAKEIIREGMSDVELSAELERTARLSGHQGITRMRAFNSEFYCGHAFSGAASAVSAFCDTPLGGTGVTPAVGQGAGNKIIASHEPIVIDFLGAADGYLCDQTRTMCIGGLPDKLLKAYDDMQAIQQRMVDIARPGTSWGAVYDDCYALACELGYKDVFMGCSGAQVSFIGHGVGTELDEYPFIARGFNEQLLEENMTFAFEPKAVYSGIGAVGIENTYVVTADGVKSLTFSAEELVVL